MIICVCTSLPFLCNRMCGLGWGKHIKLWKYDELPGVWLYVHKYVSYIHANMRTRVT